MKKITIGILYLIGIVCLNSCNVDDDVKLSDKYQLECYTDTIEGHIILTTVCVRVNDVSISTLELK